MRHHCAACVRNEINQRFYDGQALAGRRLVSDHDDDLLDIIHRAAEVAVTASMLCRDAILNVDPSDDIDFPNHTFEVSFHAACAAADAFVVAVEDGLSDAQCREAALSAGRRVPQPGNDRPPPPVLLPVELLSRGDARVRGARAVRLSRSGLVAVRAPDEPSGEPARRPAEALSRSVAIGRGPTRNDVDGIYLRLLLLFCAIVSVVVLLSPA
jgi:hypothetical protein